MSSAIGAVAVRVRAVVRNSTAYMPAFAGVDLYDDVMMSGIEHAAVAAAIPRSRPFVLSLPSCAGTAVAAVGMFDPVAIATITPGVPIIESFGRKSNVPVILGLSDAPDLSADDLTRRPEH